VRTGSVTDAPGVVRGGLCSAKPRRRERLPRRPRSFARWCEAGAGELSAGARAPGAATLSWWGKALGGAFGFVVGGPVGAAVGVALGHGMDRNARGAVPWSRDVERTRHAFFSSVFAVMGHLAKADGRVSRDEIRAAERAMRYMNLSAGQRRAAIDLFHQGKLPDFDLRAALGHFRRHCQRHPELVRLFLELQLRAALADGDLEPGERAVLLRVCEALGVSAYEFERLVNLVRGFGGGRAGPSNRPAPAARLRRAYEVLGVQPGAEPDEVKRAYRRLTSRTHPDKLVSRGLPEEMIKLAAERTREIRDAYDTIREARGF